MPKQTELTEKEADDTQLALEAAINQNESSASRARQAEEEVSKLLEEIKSLSSDQGNEVQLKELENIREELKNARDMSQMNFRRAELAEERVEELSEDVAKLSKHRDEWKEMKVELNEVNSQSQLNLVRATLAEEKVQELLEDTVRLSGCQQDTALLSEVQESLRMASEQNAVNSSRAKVAEAKVDELVKEVSTLTKEQEACSITNSGLLKQNKALNENMEQLASTVKQLESVLQSATKSEEIALNQLSVVNKEHVKLQEEVNATEERLVLQSKESSNENNGLRTRLKTVCKMQL